MSKLVLGLLVLLGGGGILAIAAVRGGGKYFSSVLDSYYDISPTAEYFKKEVEQDKCTQRTFPGIKELSKENLADVADANEEKIGKDANAPVVGCLAIRWDKRRGAKEENKDKWRGNFVFLWTFARGNKGFLIYFTADTPEPPPSNGAKMKVNAMAYVLEKDESKRTWSVSKGKEKIEKELELDKIPKIEIELLEDEGKERQFAKDGEDLSKLCSKEDCPDKRLLPDEFFNGWWVWEKETKEKEPKTTPDKWSTNLSEWWKEIHEESKWKMEDVLKGINGKWKARGSLK